MSWFPIIALAIITFGFAVIALRMEKRGWTLFAAVMVFGLAGYATQGDPALPAAPKQASVEAAQSGEAMVEARRALFGNERPPANYLITSDAFARKGQFETAASALRKGVSDNPGDAEGWLALANALVEHTNGELTPAALYAYGRADAAAPDHPGTPYFLGIAFLRSGQPGQARRIWADMVEDAPADAPWREEMAVRLERLDAMLAQSGVQGPPAQSEPTE
jgi:cytochrome c-type biogenesis protein CcmH